ncbi:Uncharacterised protein [Mycobacteroides abscessus]|nr:Uncharacterised protein [Mycobacteroides abscessus]
MAVLASSHRVLNSASPMFVRCCGSSMAAIATMMASKALLASSPPAAKDLPIASESNPKALNAARVLTEPSLALMANSRSESAARSVLRMFASYIWLIRPSASPPVSPRFLKLMAYSLSVSIMSPVRLRPFCCAPRIRSKAST